MRYLARDPHSLRLVWIEDNDIDEDLLSYEERMVYSSMESDFRSPNGDKPKEGEELSVYCWTWFTVNGHERDESGLPYGMFLPKHPKGFVPSRPTNGKSFTEPCIMVAYQSYCDVFETKGVPKEKIEEFVAEFRGYGETVHLCRPVHVLGGNLRRFHVWKWNQEKGDWQG
jgi:hypothetical protein